jgi:hypothetical protein
MLRYLSIGALLLSGAAALAEGPSYSYIQASYQEIDVDGGGDGDGFGVAGSVAVNESWFVYAGYSSFDLESTFDLDQLEVGGGWHAPVSNKTDWFVTASYIDYELSGRGFGSASEDGFGVGIGIRSMFSPSLELYGKAQYEDVGDGETSLAAGLWYTVTGNLALGAGLEVGDDITAYGVGIRLYFDK